MDLIDKKILAILDTNSRISCNELAKKLRISRQVAEYRLKQLEEKNIIKNYVAQIDPTIFVDNIWHTYIKLQNTTEKEEKQIIDYLQKSKNVWWIAYCQGEWDLIFSFAGNSLVEFDSFTIQFNSFFDKFITESITTQFVRAHMFSRGYFHDTKRIATTYIGEPINYNIDATDTKILKVLATNARMPATEIAQKTKLTTRQVMYRMKILKKQKVIRAYRLHIDTSSIEYYKVCFTANNYTKKLENSMISWCENCKHTTYFVRKIAPWSFEIEFEVPNYKELNVQLKSFKNLFGEHLKKISTTLIDKEFKGELNVLQ